MPRSSFLIGESHNDNTLNNELQITVIKDDGEAFIFNISEGYFETIRRLIA